MTGDVYTWMDDAVCVYNILLRFMELSGRFTLLLFFFSADVCLSIEMER